MFDYEYLGPAHLKGFDKYKYRSVDTNPITKYVMNPIWTWLAKLCPSSVAPNTLTFTGFLFTVLNFLILCIYDYHFHASDSDMPEYPTVPRCVWVACFINLFLANTLDAIDGKQARKTGTCSPLGELLDHGLDSWATIFIAMGLFSVLGRGEYSISILRMYWCLWAMFLNFYVSHWEKYNTGVFFLPWGSDSSVMIIEVMYLSSAIWGHSVWLFYVPGTSLTTGQILEISFWMGTLLTTLPMSLYNIYKSYKYREGKLYSFWEALRPMLAFMLLALLCNIWAVASPSNILERHPRCFFLLTGTLFSNINGRLIVSAMSNCRCSASNGLLYPLFACVVFAVLFGASARTELLLLYGVTLLSVLAHIHYGVCVVRQLCRYLKIKCFTISKLKK